MFPVTLERLRSAVTAAGATFPDVSTSTTATTASLAFSEMAAALDLVDHLSTYRSQFHFPVNEHSQQEEGKKTFKYFCGNSLGLQHQGVEDALRGECKKWRDQAVEGHFLQPNPWFEVDEVLRDDMSQVVGAKRSEVVILNSLTVNLHLLLSAFYRPTPTRNKILAERFPFPSDTHAFISQIRQHGFDPDTCFVTAGGDSSTDTELREIPTTDFLKLIEEHGDSAAVLVIGAVHFLTGQFFDIEAITRAAHAKGILVGVDCAHGVGNVELRLHDWNVDFACWCTYKYLNGGPGNIAGLYVHEKHTPDPSTGGGVHQLRGWWGHERKTRFSLHREFDASPGAAVFQLSNPCVMALASLQPSLRLCASIGMSALRQKSLLLTGYLELLIDRLVGPANVDVVTPRDPERRGCQLSIRIKPNRLAVTQSLLTSYECGTNLNNDADLAQRLLLERGVMCDNRPPNILRLAPVPTYNSFVDVFELVKILSGLFKESA